MKASLDKNTLKNTLIEFKQGKTNLTEEQLRLWFLLKLDPEMPNNILAQYELHAKLDLAVLQQAVSLAIDHFDVFNVNFTAVLGIPLRKLSKIRNSSFAFHDLSSQDNKQQFIESLIHSEQRNNFDLTSGQLVKISLIKITEDHYTFILKLSKFVGDRITADLFAQEIFGNYTQLLSNINIPPHDKQSPELLFKIERELHNKNEIKDLINSFKVGLSNIPHLALPEDIKRPLVKKHQSNSITVTLANETLSALKDFCSRQNITDIKHFLFTIYNILLYRYAQQKFFCTGILTDKREKLSQSTLLGNIENILPILIDVNSNADFFTLFSSIVSQTKLDTALIPLKTLLENVSIDRDLSRTPIIQTLFTFETVKHNFYQADSLQVNKVFMSSAQNDYDITFNIGFFSNEVKIRLDYDTNLFFPESMLQLANSFDRLTAAIINNPTSDINLLPLLSDTEKSAILADCKAVPVAIPTITLDQIIEDQAQKSPNAIAIYYQDETITYKRLNEEANRLAHYLKYRGLHTQQRIGVYLDRSIDTIVAILAVLKIGNLYIPLDTAYPEERINYMLNNSEIKVIITKSDLAVKLNHSHIKVCMDTEREYILLHPAKSLIKDELAAQSAYQMYTSGSTGQSKAVIVSHHSVVNNILWRQKCWPLTDKDRVLLNSSFSFDPSIWSIFWTLSTGAAIVIAPSHLQSDVSALITMIQERNISLIGTVPSIITLLVNEPEFTNCRSLKYLLSGGELLTSALQEKIYLRTSAQLINLYGPTETTIDATCFVTSKQTMHKNAPIGKPIANKQAYILDENMQLVPRGVTGEIFIGGAGVARGYYGRPTLTAESFLPDPFSLIPGSRLYRTGDMGKQLLDGNIEFAGRRDDQVKIRGFRIELSEVEKALELHPEIKEATVIISQEVLEFARMIAFIVPHKNEVTYANIIAYLKQHLPAYMLPNIVISLPALPKLPNDKVNRQALLQYKHEQDPRTAALKIPVNKTQEIVKEFFSDALSTSAISIDDDFFELGGTSLILSSLASRLYQRFDVAIPLHQFFKIPTIEGIAEVITLYDREGINAVMAQKHAVALADDAVLDPMIKPTGNEMANYTHPKAIFLTGATGYLGAFLLKSLLEQNSALIYCLVRADDNEHGYARIEKVMQLYHIWNKDYKSRIVIVRGDLAEKALGLTAEWWDILANKIDVIYHCGALVNFAYPYSALRAANVQGTKEVLRLACQNRLKAVHYISTIDVLLATHTPRPFIEDDAPLKHPADIAGGYTASKWVAEKIMHAASKRGIPVCIYRPGLIMSHTQTGATQTNDYILVAFRGFVPMKIMPDYARIFDIVPVDYVADAVANISLQKNCYGKFYHLFNPAPVTLFQFCEWTKTYGYQFKIVPFDQGRERALKVDNTHALFPLIPLIRDADPAPQRSLDPRFMDELQYELECKNTLDALRNTHYVCPPMSEELTHLCIKYLISIDFLPSPESLNVKNQTNEFCA
ncbi:MAG: amino acid adenylation domain-containing protein [Pseudomonadota bacterium]